MLYVLQYVVGGSEYSPRLSDLMCLKWLVAEFLG